MASEVSAPALLRRPAAAVVTTEDVLRELQALQREVAELRLAVAPDLALRTVVLAGLRAEFGGEVFTALDCAESAAARPDSEFARALAPLIGPPVGGLRRLARRLAKLAGKPGAGLVLQRAGNDRGSALYVIQTAQWAGLGRPNSSGAA